MYEIYLSVFLWAISVSIPFIIVIVQTRALRGIIVVSLPCTTYRCGSLMVF